MPKNDVFFGTFECQGTNKSPLSIICVLECINAHTNQSQLISFDKRIKTIQKVSYSEKKESLTVEQI